MGERLTPQLRARARRSLVRRDPRLARVIRASGACGLRPRGKPYEALVRSIIFQQLAGSAASAIDARVKALYGDAYPEPAALSRTRDATLRKAGLSRQKIAALRSLAEAFGEKRISSRALFRMDDAAVIESVTQVRGIGEWTAHMLLMSSLGRPDVLPVGDYGVRKGAAMLYGLDELPKPAELEALAAPWRPYRSVASWYLWRAVELPEVCEAVQGDV